MRISDVEFVRAYQQYSSQKEVSDATGLKVGSIAVRATSLRNRGVNLKKFPRQLKGTDVSGLNDLISELSGETSEETTEETSE